MEANISYARNGPVLDEIRRIRVHPQNNQTDVINKPYLRHRSAFAVHPPDRPDATMTVLALCRAIYHWSYCLAENGPVLEEIYGSRVHRQNIQASFSTSHRLLRLGQI